MAGLKHAGEEDDDDEQQRGFEWPRKKARVTAMDLWDGPVAGRKHVREDDDEDEHVTKFPNKCPRRGQQGDSAKRQLNPLEKGFLSPMR